MDDDFTHVTHKKERPQRNRKGKAKFTERSLAEKVSARKPALDESEYVQACRTLFRASLSSGAGPSSCPPPACVICLGLGSLAESSKSQDQYHLLRGLLDELGGSLVSPAQIYDPVFDEQDYRFLTEEGLEPLRIEHKLSFDTVSLLYMPHCPRSLIELLLRRNWTEEKLKKLVILGNRLDMYDDPTHPSASSKAKSPFILKAATVFRIVPLPSTKRHLEAFNDLALQWADATLLSSQSAAFWEGSESEKDQNFSSRDDREGKVAGTKTNATSELRQKQDQLERDLIAALSRVSV